MKSNKENWVKELRRFLFGWQTERGESMFNRWYRSFNDSRGYLDELSEEERTQHLNKLYRSIENEVRLTSRNSKRSRSGQAGHSLQLVTSSCSNPLTKIAAILVLGLLTTLVALWVYGPDLNTTGAGTEIVWIEKSNPAGQMSELTLPDGSQVWLGPTSTLEYPDSFSDTERIVRLYGEAYFEVNRDSGRPFSVQTGEIETHVTGTSFNVKAYPHDSNYEVTLASGEVIVKTDDGTQERVLRPDQQVRFSKVVGLSEIIDVDASLAIAWTQQELVFLRETFASIASTFERWYGVEFIFEDESLKEEVFVYHFTELSLENSMTILKELYDFEYEIQSPKVIVKRADK